MDKNTFTSNTIVDSNNIDKIIDYLNGILEEDKKVQSYVVDGKLCIVLDDGQGIVVDDKTTMGDVIYAFSDYLKFDDSVKEDNEKIKKDYGGDQKKYYAEKKSDNEEDDEDDYILSVDEELYKTIMKKLDVIGTNLLTILSKYNTYDLNEEPPELPDSLLPYVKNNPKLLIAKLLQLIEELKIKIDMCLEMFQNTNSELLIFYNEMVTQIFMYDLTGVDETENSNENQSVDNTVKNGDISYNEISIPYYWGGATRDERYTNLHQYVNDLETTYKRLVEQYEIIYGSGVKINRKKINEMMDLIVSLGLFEIDSTLVPNGKHQLNDGLLFDTNRVDGIKYATNHGFAITGDSQYINAQAWAQVLAVCEEKQIMQALKSYVYEDKSWKDSGLDDIFGTALIDWWYSVSNGIVGTEYDTTTKQLNRYNSHDDIDPEMVFLYRYLSASNSYLSSGSVNFNYKEYGLNIGASRENGAGNELLDFRAFCNIVDNINELSSSEEWSESILPYTYYYTGQLPKDFDSTKHYPIFCSKVFTLSDKEKGYYYDNYWYDDTKFYEAEYKLKYPNDIHTMGFTFIGGFNDYSLKDFANGEDSFFQFRFHNAEFDNYERSNYGQIEYMYANEENNDNSIYRRIFDIDGQKWVAPEGDSGIRGLDTFGGLNCYFIKDKECAVNTVKKYIASKDILVTYDDLTQEAFQCINLQNKINEVGELLKRTKQKIKVFEFDELKNNSDFDMSAVPTGFSDEDLKYYTKDEIAIIAYMQAHPECGFSYDAYQKTMHDTITMRQGESRAMIRLMVNEQNYENRGNGAFSDIGYLIDEFAFGYNGGIDNYIGGFANILNPEREYSADDYANMYYNSLLLQSSVIPSYVGEIGIDAYNTGSSVGYMSIPAALSFGTTLSAINAELGGSCTIRKLLSASLSPGSLSYSTYPALTSFAFALPIYGNNYSSTLKEGYSDSQAMAFALASTLVETYTEKSLGFLGGGGPLGEASQEYIQEWCDGIVRSVCLDEEFDATEVNERAKKAFKYGLLSAAILSAPVQIAGASIRLSDSIRSDNNFSHAFQSQEDLCSVIKDLDATIGVDNVKVLSVYNDGVVVENVKNGEQYAYIDGKLQRLYSDTKVDILQSFSQVDNIGVDLIGNSDISDYLPVNDSNSNISKFMEENSSLITEKLNNVLGSETLNADKTDIFKQQIARFLILSKKNILPSQLQIDMEGKLVLKKGDLLHFTRLKNAESISEKGLLTGQAFGIAEDGETFFCADFFRVSHDESLSTYSTSFRKNYNLSTFKMTGDYNTSIVFVVSPTTENADLLSFDCYSDNPNGITTKSFVNTYGLLDSNGGVYSNEGFSSVLYGVPSNQVSKILIGQGLLVDNIDTFLENHFGDEESFPGEFEMSRRQYNKIHKVNGTASEVISRLKNLFPNAILAGFDGTIIYSPNNN